MHFTVWQEQFGQVGKYPGSSMDLPTGKIYLSHYARENFTVGRNMETVGEKNFEPSMRGDSRAMFVYHDITVFI